MTKRKKKKWKVVIVMEEQYSRDAGWLTPEEIVFMVKCALDLPPDFSIKTMGAREVSKL